ncbi:MAG: hypothetical protein V7772_06170 [Pseudomonas profundi]|uniref:hypothetical protein n=1 Tax=Pseudomonas profundi TaxID=1981513 RepID=UPI00300354BE
MKSQDIGLLLYLSCLDKQVATDSMLWQLPDNKEGWVADGMIEPDLHEAQKGDRAVRYTARALEQQTGISKSQINLSLNRCYSIGLAMKDQQSGIPVVNRKALYNFIVHGLKYVFPARPGALTRGIATSFGAPVLQGKLLSAGDHLLVWPFAYGNAKGLTVEPLFKTAPFAAGRSPRLYAVLALVDAIRLGQPRESNLAVELLKEHLSEP